MSKRKITFAASTAAFSLVAATLALHTKSTHSGFKFQLGSLQITYSDFPSLA